MSAMETQYQVGMSIDCPVCGQSSVVKLATRMDGWTVVGRYYSCALCNAELGPACDASDLSVSNTTHRNQSLDRLAAALSQEAPKKVDAKALLEVDLETSHFCKDCRHFYKHPFADTCLLHRRRTNPMDDCPQFERTVEEDAHETVD